VIFDESNKESVGVALEKHVMGMLFILTGAGTASSNVTHRVERDERTTLHNELDSSREERFPVFQEVIAPLMY
jgi:hypothetical protein